MAITALSDYFSDHAGIIFCIHFPFYMLIRCIFSSYNSFFLTFVEYPEKPTGEVIFACCTCFWSMSFFLRYSSASNEKPWRTWSWILWVVLQMLSVCHMGKLYEGKVYMSMHVSAPNYIHMQMHMHGYMSMHICTHVWETESVCVCVCFWVYICLKYLQVVVLTLSTLYPCILIDAHLGFLNLQVLVQCLLQSLLVPLVDS